MTDLAYIIESADVRLPNACPELPDMEFEPVAAVKTAVCERCGNVYEIHSGRPTSYCKACRYLIHLEKDRERYEKKKRMKYRKPREFTTENVREATREAMRHGISYGKYMQMIRRRTK